jgi:hypothetical protein
MSDALGVGFELDLAICSGNSDYERLQLKIKTKVKSVGQECPTHTA